MQIKSLFAQKIDSYVSLIDDQSIAHLKQLEEKQRQLKQANEDIQKYRVELLVY